MTSDQFPPPHIPFTELVNLAARGLGAGAVAASDEAFAEKENLLRAEPPLFQPRTFGNRGQVMDGWETRRRRGGSADAPHPAAGEHDWAVVRLGVPGRVAGVVVDTAHFTGNYPESASVEAAYLPGHPGPEELAGADWFELVPRTALKGDTVHELPVAAAPTHRQAARPAADPTAHAAAHPATRLASHVRLNIWPDGGVARLRVHGEALPDPLDLAGLTFDLAAQEYGGVAVAASDRFYSTPHHLNALGRAAVMGDGWETRRRRDDGNDWAELRLAGEGEVLAVEIDTTHFVHNAPGWAAVSGRDAATGAWFPLLERVRLQPDTRHRYRIDPVRPVTHARLDVYPDGGVARLRLTGRLTPAGLAALADRRLAALPADDAARLRRRLADTSAPAAAAD